MPVVVSDSSVLIGLGAVRQLGLLRDYHQEILIPEAVWREVTVDAAQRPGAPAVIQAQTEGWLHVRTPGNCPLLASLRARLDAGEAEAIALAVESNASLILLDENEGRTEARALGLAVTGTLGLLVRARREGRLSALILGRTWLGGLFALIVVAGFATRVCGEVNEGYRGLSYSERGVVLIPAFRGISVNTFNGNLTLRPNLLFVPVRGIPVEFALTYNSDHRNISSPFGLGWSLSYHVRYVRDAAGNVTVLWSDGRQDRFLKDGAAFTAPVGVYLTLTEPAASQMRLTTREGIQYRFDDGAHQRLTAIVDPNNNTLALAYDGGNRLTSVTAAAGRAWGLQYDAAGRLQQITDPNLDGRTVSFTYDAAGRLTRITDPLNQFEAFGYDAANLLTSITDRRGNVATITYTTPAWDANTRLPQTLSKGGVSVSFAFDDATRTTTFTDGRSNSWRFVYDALGRVTEVVDPANQSEFHTWDANRNRLSRTDRNGNLTTGTYDARGNLLTWIDAANKTNVFTYEPVFSRLLSATDRNGHTWAHEYDAQGNRIRTTDPANNVIARVFDATGQLVRLTNRGGNAFQFEYDAVGNLSRVTDPLTNQTRFEYDGAGRLLRVVDASSNTNSYTYDALSRLTSASDGSNQVTRLGYDPVGNLVAVTNPLAAVTRYEYDALDRMTAVTDPLGKADARSYDALNRLTQRADPLGSSWQYAYDAEGNLASLTDPLGQVTTHAYDALGRLIQQTFAADSTAAFTYDAEGRLVTAVDPNSNYAYAYDAVGRPTVFTDNALSKSVQYSYDAAGRLASLTGPEGDLTTYTRDAVGRVVQRQTPSGLTTFGYDANGNLTAQILPNGVASSYAYDDASQVTQITHKDRADTVLAGFTYTRDTLGRITRSDLANGRYNESYYDALGRLARDAEVAEFQGDSTPVWSYGFYTYDLAGNKGSYSQSGIYGQIAWDAVSRPLTDSGWSFQGATFTHDANGSRTQMKENAAGGLTRDYTYDARGRMIRVTVSGWSSDEHTYTYDVFNRLIRVDQSGSGVTQRLLYDGQYPIAEYNAAGTVTAKWFNTPHFAPDDQRDGVSLALKRLDETFRGLFSLPPALRQRLSRYPRDGVSIALNLPFPLHQEDHPSFRWASPTETRNAHIVITKDNPGKATGRDQVVFPLFGDLHKPVGSSTLTDSTGALAGRLPHNSRGEAVNRADNLYPEAGYTPTLMAFWLSAPGEFDASWPANGRISASGRVEDHWTGGTVVKPVHISGPAPVTGEIIEITIYVLAPGPWRDFSREYTDPAARWRVDLPDVNLGPYENANNHVLYDKGLTFRQMQQQDAEWKARQFELVQRNSRIGLMNSITPPH